MEASTDMPAVESIFLDCVDITLLRETVTTCGYNIESSEDIEIARIYYTDKKVSSTSPNPYFEEAWYLEQYDDVRRAVEGGGIQSAFLHFIKHGIFEGRFPSATMAEGRFPLYNLSVEEKSLACGGYAEIYPDAALFVAAFPVITIQQFLDIYGRKLGWLIEDHRDIGKQRQETFQEICRQFDADWYTSKYLTGINDKKFATDPLMHYLVHGMHAGNSPNNSFDETFYRIFYPEIQRAIEKEDIPSGFYHYILAGRNECRLPAFERKQVLEARLPGVTRTVLADNAFSIEERLKYRQVIVDALAPKRLVMMLPTINPDITFGGYRSAFEFLRRAHEEGWKITILCTEDASASVEYFMLREKSSVFLDLFRKIHFVPHIVSEPVSIGSKDVLIVYSMWDLYFAAHIRHLAPEVRIVVLSQEYEPIFHENSSARAFLEEAYKIPHYALINSDFLKKYFKTHRIGVFGQGKSSPKIGKDYTVFEHRINQLCPQSVDDIRSRKTRFLVAYTRPEAHAARNLYEILILALRKICSEGAFGPDWQFIGLGALTDLPAVSLGNGHQLLFRAKMSEEEYITYINSMDIGLSLMYAPHPSVMPFEFATTGALVVTNTYENRSIADFEKISQNIIGAPPTVDGIAEALRIAISRVSDAEGRLRNIFRPLQSSWDTIFNAGLIRDVCGDST